MTFTPPLRAHICCHLTHEASTKERTQIIRDDGPI